MRSLAIMQPYLFPYLGYFQLIQATDRFMFLDNVQYTRRGWINRNKIEASGKAAWITFPVRKGPRDISILESRYDTPPAFLDKQRKKFQQAYKGAAYLEETLALIESILSLNMLNVAERNIASIERICGHLGLERPFLRSSAVPSAREKHSQDRIIALALHCRATRYINAPGGYSLYDGAAFEQAGLELCFLKSGEKARHLFSREEETYSIIDSLAHHGRKTVADALMDFELECGSVGT